MSISFPMTDVGSTLERVRGQGGAGCGDAGRVGGKPAASAARIEANRRNSRKSTGPRTIQGKRRAARNALKHGLCRTLSCLPSDCEATFMTFVEELREELRPATAMQRLAFNQIASLTWRLERLPEAQTKLFAEELEKVSMEDDAGGALSPSDVLARRFSDDPGSNGFALMERYERGMRNQLLRLLRHFDQLKKDRATTPYDPGEPPCPPERAWRAIDEEAKQSRIREARGEGNAQQQKQPADWLEARQAHLQREAEENAREWNDGDAPSGGDAPGPDHAAERTQSNPPGNVDSEQRDGKCALADDAPVTERSQTAELPHAHQERDLVKRAARVGAITPSAPSPANSARCPER